MRQTTYQNLRPRDSCSDGTKWGIDFRYDGLSVRPVFNESVNINLPESSSEKASQGIYNLYGIKVADNGDNLKPGVYIQGGKKYVVR